MKIGFKRTVINNFKFEKNLNYHDLLSDNYDNIKELGNNNYKKTAKYMPFKTQINKIKLTIQYFHC